MKVGDIVKVVSETTSLTKSAQRLGMYGKVLKIDISYVEVDFVGDGDYWDTRYVSHEDLKVVWKKV